MKKEGSRNGKERENEINDTEVVVNNFNNKSRQDISIY